MIGQPHKSSSVSPKVFWPALIVVVLGLIVGGFFVLNNYIYNEKQEDNVGLVIRDQVNENQVINTESVQKEAYLNKMLVDYTGRGDTVYLVDTLSGDTTTILQEASLYNARSVHLSPNGTKIVYSLVEKNSSERESVTIPRVVAIRLLDLDTNESKVLRSFNLDELHPSNPQFSADGDYIAYLSYSEDELFVNFLDINSLSNSEYTTPFYTESYGSIYWIPNSDAVILALDNKVYQVSLEGEFEELYDAGELRTIDLITGGTRDIPTIGLEVYSKNANAISDERSAVYFSKYDNGVENIYRMNADGDEVQQITYEKKNEDYNIRYGGVSPDGVYGLLIETPPGQEPTTSSVILFDFQTGERSVIYEGSKYWNPYFSPDSQSIAFSDFWDDPGIFIYDINEKIFTKASDVSGQVMEWK